METCGKCFDNIWCEDVAGIVRKINVVVDCQGELEVW